MIENEKWELASKMHSPFRCPGQDYHNGQSVYNFGGYLVPCQLLDGKDAREIPGIIEEWKKSNPKYKIGSRIGKDGRRYRAWVLDEIAK